MATTGTEKHARLSIMLMKGGTKITRRLFEKRVVQLTPNNHTPSPWTVDDFLLVNKEKILKFKDGRNKERIFFPGVTDKTNLHHWDLSMFCFILLESADVSREVRMDIEKLRKLRNKLCHLSEPSLEMDTYNNYLDKIEIIFERILKVIGETTLENEINDMLKSIKEGPLSIDDALRQMKSFYMMEEETKKILSAHSKDHEAMLNKLDTIIEQTKPKEDAMQLPDTDVEIRVKNCNSDKERRLSEFLVKLIDENIHKNTDIPNELRTESFSKLREAVAEAVRTFLASGRQITSTEKKCVLLRIRCLSLKNLVSLFRDCVSGKLNQQLKPIETAVKQIPEFEDVILEAVIHEEEFWCVMEKTVSAVDKYVSASRRTRSKVTLGHSHSSHGTVHTVRLTIPTETDRQLKELRRRFESGNVEKITKDIEQAACEELNLTDVSVEARLLDKESKSERQEIQVEKKYKQFAAKSRKKGSKNEKRKHTWKRLATENQLKLQLFDFKTQQHYSELEDSGFEIKSQRKECSLKASEDSGIGSDIFASSSYDEFLSEVENLEQLSTISSDDNQSLLSKGDSEDKLSDRENRHCVSFNKMETSNTCRRSEEELDELLVQHGIKLNESFLSHLRSKSLKHPAFYQELRNSEELKRLMALDPKRYLSGIIHVEGSHEAYCNPITKDAGDHLSRIEISGRSKIGQVYNEDEVVVELLDSKQKCERRFGKVLGVLKRHRCKKENIKHPVFLCTPDDAYSHTVRPMCKTVPKIHVMHETIQQKYRAKESSRYKVEIYEYDENAEILCNPRIETLSQAELQSCVFLVAIISWELNQIYPKGAIIKRFPYGKTLKSGLDILNLRYEITKMFSHETVKELEMLRENISDKCSTSGNLDEDLIQDKSDLHCFTIDQREAHDLNFAISLEKLDLDCYKVGVHIIDVSAYIKKGSPLDKDALKRALTIHSKIDTPRYMLPEDIAVKLCSLLQNEKRPVISIYLFLQSNGKSMQTTNRSYQIEQSFIKCCRNFSFEEAEEVAKGRGLDKVTKDMKCLFRLMGSARKSRLGRSKNFLSNNEIQRDDNVQGFSEAQCVVEELTIMVNRKVAELMFRNNISIPFFTQKPPSSKDLESFCQRYGSFLNILVHFQNQKVSPSLTLMVENVLNLNVHQNVVLIDSVWRNIKDLSPTAADSILDDSLHPIQFVIYAHWLSIQKHPEYMCSSKELTDKEHFGLGFERYTHCTFPTRRYSDLVVQRMLHYYLKKQELPYESREIEEICEHINDVSVKTFQYQRNCISLQKGLALTTQEKMQTCFVFEVSEQSLTVKDKPESPFNCQDFELLCNILDMGYKPEIQTDITTNWKQLNGKWRKRLYDLKRKKSEVSLINTKNENQQESSEARGNNYFQILNPNADVTFIELQQWARLVKNAADNHPDDLKRNIKRVVALKTREGSKDVSTESIDISNIDTNTKFSLMFRFGQPLNIQMHAKPSKGIISPQPMLLEMTDNVKLCLQHMDDPILHLCKYSTRPSLDQYRSCEEYTSIWLPIVLMEAAVNAISNEEGCSINNVEVNILNEKEGMLMLPLDFCEERSIDFSGSRTRRIEEGDPRHTFDWLCIKSKIPSCHNSTKENKTNSLQNVWVGHAQVSEVKLEKKEINGQSQEVYMITFNLHENSRTFRSHDSKSNDINCSIEILRKTDVDRRIESALRTLHSRTNVLALDIALKRKLQPLDEGHRQKAEIIDRDLNLDAKDLDQQSKPLPRNNQKQQEAIDMALRNRFTLIQGPPGTGKTYTGIKLIYLFNKINYMLHKKGNPKKQVLFCGPSNKSVDLVAKWMLRRLGKKCPDFLRIYGQATEAEDFPIPGVSFQSRGSKIHKADKELRSVTLHFLIRNDKSDIGRKIMKTEKEFESYRLKRQKPKAAKIKEYLKLLTKASIEEIKKHEVLLCTTSFGSNPKLLMASTVFQVIVDEAGMCPEPQCMVPLIATKAEQIVMIGDHKQLRPIVKCKAAAELGLDKSLFERYATTNDKIGPFIMLNEQYRMNPQLCEFPSEQFYQGQLETKRGHWGNDKVNVWQTDALGKVYPHILIHIEGEESVLTVNTDYGSEQSRSNAKEIDIVIKVYRFLVEENISPEKINVISQYNAQCKEMKESLEREGFTNYIVNTVVSSQGGEWDYVIFSTVRSLPEYKIELNSTIGWRKHNLGFITDTNQINVALTRARKGLIIIGNKNLLYCDPVWKKLISHYEQRKCVKLANEFPPHRTRQAMIRNRQRFARAEANTNEPWDKMPFKSTGAIPKRR